LESSLLDYISYSFPVQQVFIEWFSSAGPSTKWYTQLNTPEVMARNEVSQKDGD
jgi:hypothetical protein